MRYLLISLFCLFAQRNSLFLPSPVNAPTRVQSQSGQDALERGLRALNENRLEDALKELTRAERERPLDARVRNFKGILLVRMGKNEEAAAEYQAAMRFDPRFEDAYRNLGFLRWSEHQLAAAREMLEHAITLRPDDSFAHYYLGRVELDGKRYEQAFHELESSRQPLPDDIGFLFQAATGYIALGRFANARNAIEQLTKHPLNAAQSLEAASLLLSIHENRPAINLVEKLRSGQSGIRGGWVEFDLALANLLAGNYEEAAAQAVSYLEAAQLPVAQTNDVAQGWSVAGISYAHLNQVERSVDALRKAASLAPGEEQHWLNLTLRLMELGRYPEAISEVESGLAKNPKSYALHLRLGAAWMAAGRYPEAESVFRELVTAGDPLPTSYVGLAQVLLRTGRAEEAATELADAEKRLGPKFLISYFRGLALDHAGRTAEALAAFKDAVQLDPTSAEAHLNLGKTQFATGRTNEAIAELEEALRLDPGDKQAKRLLSQAYRRAGDRKNAAKFAESSAEDSAAPIPLLLGDFLVPEWQAPPQTSEK